MTVSLQTESGFSRRAVPCLHLDTGNCVADACGWRFRNGSGREVGDLFEWVVLESQLRQFYWFFRSVSCVGRVALSSLGGLGPRPCGVSAVVGPQRLRLGRPSPQCGPWSWRRFQRETPSTRVSTSPTPRHQRLSGFVGGSRLPDDSRRDAKTVGDGTRRTEASGQKRTGVKTGFKTDFKRIPTGLRGAGRGTFAPNGPGTGLKTDPGRRVGSDHPPHDTNRVQ